MSRVLTTSTTALIALSLTAGLTLAVAHAAQSSLSSTGSTSPLGKPNVSTPSTTSGTSTPGNGTTISEPSGSTTFTPSGPYTTSPNWRPVSGYTGDHSVIYSLAGSTYALTRLAFYEHSDDPNHIEIWTEQLCYHQPCDPGPRDGSLHVGNKEENLGSREIIAAGDDHYITAIQVCTTNENDVRKRKIKGARIWTARLEPGGIVNRTGYDPVEFDRPNCNNHWRAKQLCIGNRVAVDLKAYYNDDWPQWNSRRYITGLELECAHVVDPGPNS